jgi:asparagine N-glycosylation enzyme membrane subunit Stt3
MKLLRRIHLFLGCFFAPILVFFICTGWYQTVTHDRKKGLGEAESWVERLTTVHVDQIYPTAAETYSTTGFKFFIVAMSVALLATIVLGIILAFRFSRPKWPVWLSLVLGFGVPVLLLWLGQNR